MKSSPCGARSNSRRADPLLYPYKDDGVVVPYTLIWGWLHLANHRYGTVPTGAMQVIMTIVAMNALGYHPTVTELAEITDAAAPS